jgi:hypothetical protein
MLEDNSSQENYSDECIIYYTFSPDDLSLDKTHKFTDDGKFLYCFDAKNTFKKLCLETNTHSLEIKFPEGNGYGFSGGKNLQELVIQGKYTAFTYIPEIMKGVKDVY